MRILKLVLFFTISFCSAKKITVTEITQPVQKQSILDSSLDQFLEKVVDKHDQEEFRGYYSQFLEKQSRKRRNGKQSGLRRLRADALKIIRKEHPEWYKELEPLVLDLEEQTLEARQARLFLTRFALLQEYHDSKQFHPGWWDRTTSHIKQFGHKIARLKDSALGRKRTLKA